MISVCATDLLACIHFRFLIFTFLLIFSFCSSVCVDLGICPPPPGTRYSLKHFSYFILFKLLIKGFRQRLPEFFGCHCCCLCFLPLHLLFMQISLYSFCCCCCFFYLAPFECVELHKPQYTNKNKRRTKNKRWTRRDREVDRVWQTEREKAGSKQTNKWQTWHKRTFYAWPWWRA